MKKRYTLEQYFRGVSIGLATLIKDARAKLVDKEGLDSVTRYAAEIIASPRLKDGWNNESEQLKIMHAINYLDALRRKDSNLIFEESESIAELTTDVLYKNLKRLNLSHHYLELSNFINSDNPEHRTIRARGIDVFRNPNATDVQLREAAGYLMVKDKIINPLLEDYNDTVTPRIISEYLRKAKPSPLRDNIQLLYAAYDEAKMSSKALLRGVLDALVNQYNAEKSIDPAQGLLAELVKKSPGIAEMLNEPGLNLGAGNARGAIFKLALEPSGAKQIYLKQNAQLSQAIDSAMRSASNSPHRRSGGNVAQEWSRLSSLSEQDQSAVLRGENIKSTKAIAELLTNYAKNKNNKEDNPLYDEILQVRNDIQSGSLDEKAALDQLLDIFIKQSKSNLRSNALLGPHQKALFMNRNERNINKLAAINAALLIDLINSNQELAKDLLAEPREGLPHGAPNRLKRLEKICDLARPNPTQADKILETVNSLKNLGINLK